MARYLEYFFRRWPLALLPVILVAGLAAFFGYGVVEQYQSEATIWAERPTLVELNLGWNPDVSSAQNQYNRLSQLMQTDGFLDQVAARTQKLLPGANVSRQDLTANLKAAVASSNLITVKSVAGSPELARAQNQALFETYRERYVADLTGQSNELLASYQTRLKTFQDKLQELDTTTGVYLANHPQLLQNPASANLDPELQTLRRQTEYNQSQADTLQGKIDQITIQSQLNLQGQNSIFRQEGAPTLPTGPQTSKTSRAILYGALGAVAGLLIGLAYLIIGASLNRTFFRASDLAALTGTTVYTSPRLKKVRVTQPPASVTARTPEPVEALEKERV